tara:strand:- start:146 stop:751 length:606 start_codon:yes stop_codon:yes gene_type:complete
MRNPLDWEVLIGLLLLFLIPLSAFGLYSNDNPIADFIQTFTYDDDASRGIDIVNEYRIANGRDIISFDQRLYDLAYFKSKEMFQKKYLDHPDKTGNCIDDYKEEFGIHSGSIADNLYEGRTVFLFVSFPVFEIYKDAVAEWSTSRGHRYNLLYPNHVSGALACYYYKCTFVGLNHDGYGEDCATGEEGLEFWETAEIQMHE